LVTPTIRKKEKEQQKKTEYISTERENTPHLQIVNKGKNRKNEAREGYQDQWKELKKTPGPYPFAKGKGGNGKVTARQGQKKGTIKKLSSGVENRRKKKNKR